MAKFLFIVGVVAMAACGVRERPLISNSRNANIPDTVKPGLHGEFRSDAATQKNRRIAVVNMAPGDTSAKTARPCTPYAVENLRDHRVLVSGGLSRTVVLAVLRKRLQAIRQCIVEFGYVSNPCLVGAVAISFSIGPSGGVKGARISESTLRHAHVESCVLDVVRKTAFPKSTKMTRVRYPLIFSVQ